MQQRLARLAAFIALGVFLGGSPAVLAAQAPVYYTNELSIDPARTAEFIRFVTEAARQTRAFKGCRYFAILVDDQDPTRVVFYEIWDSKEDHQAYRKWRGETGFTERIQPFLKGSKSHYYIKVDD
jgi:quinol monooxygenase YgiN